MKPIYADGNKNTINKLIQLRKEAKKDKAINVALRIQGIILSLEKYTTGEIAQMLKVNRTTVPIWINNWNSFKEEGLFDGYKSGRKKLLTDEDINILSDIIDSGPISYGLNTGVWTCPIIAQIIEREFNIHYHVGHVWKILKKIGFSLQRPAHDLINGKPQEKRRWIRYIYPNLKKKRVQKTP